MTWKSLTLCLGLIGVLAGSSGCTGDDEASDTGTSDGSTDTSDSSTTTEQGEGEYCPGVMEWPESVSTCRAEAECDALEGFLDCYPTQPAPGCHDAGGCANGWATGDCSSNDDCINFGGEGVDGVCKFAVDPCCGETSGCFLVCTPDSCAADEVCGMDGLCAPALCDAGYACGEGRRCEVGAVGADAHGCVVIPCDEPDATPCPVTHACSSGTCARLPCTVDDDCPCGTCMVSECWDRPWICVDTSGL